MYTHKKKQDPQTRIFSVQVLSNLMLERGRLLALIQIMFESFL